MKESGTNPPAFAGATMPCTLSSLTGARVLVLAPHPDDEVLGCGGAIRLHTLAGDAVKVLVFTDGRHGHGPDRVDLDDLVRQRQRESRASAAVLGVSDIEFWPLHDRTLGSADAVGARLVTVLEGYRPDLVYVPSPIEHHPDHRAAAELLWRAAGVLLPQTRVAFYEISQPIIANTLIDISRVLADKKRAVEQHRSQLEMVPYGDLILGLNRYRSYTVSGQATAVEGFFVTPALHLVDQPMAAFYAWLVNPMQWKEPHPKPARRLASVVRSLLPHRKRKAAGVES